MIVLYHSRLTEYLFHLVIVFDFVFPWQVSIWHIDRLDVLNVVLDSFQMLFDVYS